MAKCLTEKKLGGLRSNIKSLKSEKDNIYYGFRQFWELRCREVRSHGLGESMELEDSKVLKNNSWGCLLTEIGPF